MTKTTFRKLGLGACMLLMAASGMPFTVAPAFAAVSCTTEDGIQTCTDTVTTEVVSVTQVGNTGGGTTPTTGGGTTTTTPTIDASTFTSNPAALFQNPGALGANVTNLLQQGVSSDQISQLLSSAGGGLNTNQWSSVLNNLTSNGSINTATAANLVSGLFGQTVSPALGQALSAVSGLGNITSVSGLTNLLGNPAIKQALSALTGAQAGTAIDQVLQAALGGNLNLSNLQNLATQAGMQALTNAISNVAPQLANLLGAGGIQQALTGALNSLAGGAVGNALGGLLGGGLTSALGGGLAGGLGAAAGIASGAGIPGNCACTVCTVQIPQHHVQIRTEVTTDFEEYRTWSLTTWFQGNLLPALMLMAEQLTTTGMLQVEIIGTFLDAKHQLETQRLFQTLTAKAHKDYQPSEGMCTFGTTVRSLASSERLSDLAQTAFARQMMQRQALNGEAISYQGTDSDIRSRTQNFIKKYCDKTDNANGLTYLCAKSPDTAPERHNIDVDFTRNIESRLTLDTDFLGANTAQTTADEEDVFALASNLYSHTVAPNIMPELLASGEGNLIRQSAVEKYMDLRSIFAKRSVAQNSFAAMVAMRAAGAPESAPYTKAIMRELGVSKDDEIEKLLGKNPSYFAQMEVLTKKLYQNPVFYTELYDKPVNIERKGAALQAIGLMQDRDLYNSLLRSEAVLSVLLETQLQREQEKATNAMGRINAAGGSQ